MGRTSFYYDYLGTYGHVTLATVPVLSDRHCALYAITEPHRIHLPKGPLLYDHSQQIVWASNWSSPCSIITCTSLTRQRPFPQLCNHEHDL